MNLKTIKIIKLTKVKFYFFFNQGSNFKELIPSNCHLDCACLEIVFKALGSNKT